MSADPWPTCEYQTCGRPQPMWPFSRGQVPICLALSKSSSGKCARTRWNPDGSTGQGKRGK